MFDCSDDHGESEFSGSRCVDTERAGRAVSTAAGCHDSSDDVGDFTGAFVEHVHIVHEDGEDV